MLRLARISGPGLLVCDTLQTRMPSPGRSNGHARGLIIACSWLAVLFLCAPEFVVGAQAEVGQSAPPLELPRIGGKDSELVSLKSLEGKIVYLDFWASWCGPCLISFPVFDQLRQEFNPRGFEILAVNVDEYESDALLFLKDRSTKYPVVRDGAGDTPRLYGIRGMPTGFLLDRQGVIRYRHEGFRRADGDRLRERILQLLEEDNP
ncbi:MAG: TlpA disulfide reductase family protein [Gammaproteobacteria bacterium]|nr:TlpA disulfide reductase family protein [Gammaproteobacteria bacterium]